MDKPYFLRTTPVGLRSISRGVSLWEVPQHSIPVNRHPSSSSYLGMPYAVNGSTLCSPDGLHTMTYRREQCSAIPSGHTQAKKKFRQTQRLIVKTLPEDGHRRYFCRRRRSLSQSSVVITVNNSRRDGIFPSGRCILHRYSAPPKRCANFL